MKLVIDRFEGEMAVCERSDRVMVNIARYLLPPDAKEGDVLIIDGNHVEIDFEETEKRRSLMQKMMRRLEKQ